MRRSHALPLPRMLQDETRHSAPFPGKSRGNKTGYTGTPKGKLMLNLLGSFAEFERQIMLGSR